MLAAFVAHRNSARDAEAGEARFHAASLEPRVQELKDASAIQRTMQEKLRTCGLRKALPLLVGLWVLPLSAKAIEPGNSFLDLTYQEFDQTPGSGWRALTDKKQFREGAALIDAYLDRRSDLDRFQRATLHWHAAQALAIAGDTAAALKHMAHARHHPEPPQSPICWNDYVTATEAFLQKDRSKLLAARARVARNKPDDANLVIIDSLIANFGQPYAEAYKRE